MTSSEGTAYIGLGSNLESPAGDRARHLELAIEALDAVGQVTRRSSVYETLAWGVSDEQPDYLNQVVRLETALAPDALVPAMLEIEKGLGRVRAERFGSRIIDLDVLLMGESLVESDGVQIPHPRLHERAFVLVPLIEIAPDLIHPALGKPLSELLANVDRSGVRLYSSVD